MASISGTVTIDGSPDMAMIGLYDLDDPYVGFPPIIEANGNEWSDSGDGSYTFTDSGSGGAVVEGHDYILCALSASSDNLVKPLWNGGVKRSGLATPILASGDIVGVDFVLESGGGVRPSGVTYNCPEGTVMTGLHAVDVDEYYLMGHTFGEPNGDYASAEIRCALYGDTYYRGLFLAMDEYGPLDMGWWSNHLFVDYVLADNFLGGATGIDFDFSFPSPTKERQLDSLANLITPIYVYRDDGKVSNAFPWVYT